MIKVLKLDDATRDQLLVFAQTNLGLDLKGNASKTDIISSIRAANNQITQIEVADEQGPAKPKQNTTSVPNKIKIRIHMGDDEHGKRPIPVGVNGKITLLPRAEDIEVTKAQLEVLKNAVQTKHTPNEKGGTNQHEAQLYPFSVIG